MQIEQENITTFRKQVNDINNFFSHEGYVDLNECIKIIGNKLYWLKPVNKAVFEKVEEAAKKYLR